MMDSRKWTGRDYYSEHITLRVGRFLYINIGYSFLRHAYVAEISFVENKPGKEGEFAYKYRFASKSWAPLSR